MSRVGVRPTIALIVGIPLLCAWALFALLTVVCDWAVLRVGDWGVKR
jgi:hypothetical protein